MDYVMARLIGHCACLLTGLGAGALLAVFAAIEPSAAPVGGSRGASRRQVLESLGSFAFLDGCLRRLASLMHGRIPASVGGRMERRLERAGDYLGFSSDEFVSLSAATCVAFCLVGSMVSDVLGGGNAGLFASAVLGALFWPLRLDAAIRTRVRAAERELPGVIDLIAMAMAAGLDFTRAVRLVVTSSGSSVVVDELQLALRDLGLGSSRRAVLELFSRRLPSRGVQDFASAVIQAETKGTPLSDVLEAQAIMLRSRRSVAAEEAAARAGVLLMLPLMLLMGCVVLLLVAPLLVQGGL
jgi:tight adherence protein C